MCVTPLGRPYGKIHKRQRQYSGQFERKRESKSTGVTQTPRYWGHIDPNGIGVGLIEFYTLSTECVHVFCMNFRVKQRLFNYTESADWFCKGPGCVYCSVRNKYLNMKLQGIEFRLIIVLEQLTLSVPN
jgi:hypothetical protein